VKIQEARHPIYRRKCLGGQERGRGAAKARHSIN